MIEPHALHTFGLAIAAALVSAGLIVLLRPLLQRYALARPNARSSHTRPTPQGAGIAVILATLVVLIGWDAIGARSLPLTLIAATLFIAVVGLLDDIRPIPVAPRL